jgi:hypothetical protein
MAADARAEVEIALKDNLSPALRNMARDIRALNRSIRDLGDDGQAGMEKAGKAVGGLGSMSKNALRDLTAMSSFMSGFTTRLIGSLGTVAALQAVTRAVNDLAYSRVQLSMFAQDSRFAANDIQVMRGAMARMGIDAKQADQYIGGLANKLQELGALKQGSSLFRDLQNMGQGGVNLANQLLGDVKVGDYKKAVDDIIDVFKKQGPDAQFWMSQTLGIPVSVLKNLDDYRRKVGDVFLANEDAMKRYVNNVESMRQYVNNEFDRMSSHVLEKIDDISGGLDKASKNHTISDWFNSEVDKTINDANNLYEDLSRIGEKIKSAWDKVTTATSPETTKNSLAGAFDPFRTPKKSSDFLFSDMAQEQLRTQEDSKKVLEDIRDTLNRMGGEGSGGGGGGAGSLPTRGGGMGVRSPGSSGNMRATLGGFRPGGGINTGNVAHDMAASLKAAGMSDTGIAAVLGTAQQESGLNPLSENASGHKGLFQWERSRQPGDFSVPGQMSHFLQELKQRDPAGFAKLQDPKTTPDEAMEVMNNFERFRGYRQGERGAEAGGRYNYMRQYGAQIKDGVLQPNVGGGNSGVIGRGTDPRLAEIITSAAKHLPPGYRVEQSSGYRPGDSGQHGRGMAADVKIIGPDGKEIRNRGEDTTGMYEALARHSYGEMLARYPDLKGRLAWGGNFGTQKGGGGENDLMHLDLGGDRGRRGAPLTERGPMPGEKYGTDFEAARASIDKATAATANISGGANVTVDFKNVPSGVKTSADADGVFKSLKINRESQMPKSGDSSTDNRYSRWYFQ